MIASYLVTALIVAIVALGLALLPSAFKMKRIILEKLKESPKDYKELLAELEAKGVKYHPSTFFSTMNHLVRSGEVIGPEIEVGLAHELYHTNARSIVYSLKDDESKNALNS